MTDRTDIQDALPVRAPDLVLEQATPQVWRVQRASASAQALGWEQGRLLAGELAGTPPLPALLAEVAAHQQPLIDILWGLPAGTFRLALQPWGLDPDTHRQRIAVQFEVVPDDRAPAPDRLEGLVGTSPVMREVFRKLALYAGSDAAVVITGETGTGKELAAAALHRLGPRHAGELVAVNCAAISEQLLESELFGHERGAFTGAVRTHRGRFERAHGGTLFLDEIGEMPRHTQAKLLRAIELGRIERVGAEAEIPVDVRLVSATNRPLEQEVARGRFRADLYHRLAVLHIHLPPLRERREDIPVLAEHFLESFRQKYGRTTQRLTREAMALLQAYRWPGNVRELRNVLERVFVETQAEVIGARAFADWVRERQEFHAAGWGLANPSVASPPVVPPYPLPDSQRLLGAPEGGEVSLLQRTSDLDEEALRSAYRASSGNLAAAARRLGVHRATLYRYLERHGLTREDLAQPPATDPTPPKP